MSKAEKKHNIASDRLSNNPPSCIDSVLISAREVNVWGTNRTLIKKPDNLYIDVYGNWTLLEYKSSDCHREGALCQLNRSAERIEWVLGIKPRKLFAYSERGRVRIEEVYK